MLCAGAGAEGRQAQGHLGNHSYFLFQNKTNEHQIEGGKRDEREDGTMASLLLPMMTYSLTWTSVEHVATGPCGSPIPICWRICSELVQPECIRMP